MRDRKYRIKEVVNGLGESVYYPQYKDWIFWQYFYKYDYGDTRIKCNTKEAALHYIESNYRTFRKDQISKEIIFEITPKV